MIEIASPAPILDNDKIAQTTAKNFNVANVALHAHANNNANTADPPNVNVYLVNIDTLSLSTSAFSASLLNVILCS
jgi:hypothetical protein